MSRTELYSLVAAAALGMLLTNCSTTERLTRRSQLKSAYETGPITVRMKDGREYRLVNYKLSDSVLSALSGGAEMDSNHRAARPFRGDLPLNDIAVVQTSSPNVGKALLGVGVTAIFVGVAVSYLGGNNSLSLTQSTRYIGPSGGGGIVSCPSIYGWNGAKYILEGEAFGTAVGKPLETNSWFALPSLSQSSGDLKLRIANERAETHFVNSVALVATEVDPGETICVGSDGRLWPLAHPTPPISATDPLGRDVLPQVCARDGRYWETGIASLRVRDGFRDTLLLRYVRPTGGMRGDASLVIDAINTSLSEVALAAIFRFLGNQSLEFMQQLEQDPGLIESVKGLIGESKLNVSVWNGTAWAEVGEITPEAVMVPFSRLVRLNTGSIAGDTLLIRLESARDGWRIDAAQMDWTPARELARIPLQPASCVRPDGEEVSVSLASGDDRYVVLLPPDFITLTYKPIKPSPGKKIVYAVNVSGYLHEWIPAASKSEKVSFASFIPPSSRMGFLKMLLRNEEMLLPAIYEELADLRQRQETR